MVETWMNIKFQIHLSNGLNVWDFLDLEDLVSFTVDVLKYSYWPSVPEGSFNIPRRGDPYGWLLSGSQAPNKPPGALGVSPNRRLLPFTSETSKPFFTFFGDVLTISKIDVMMSFQSPSLRSKWNPDRRYRNYSNLFQPPSFVRSIFLHRYFTRSNKPSPPPPP